MAENVKKSRMKKAEVLEVINLIQKYFEVNNGSFNKPITNSQIQRHLLGLNLKVHAPTIREYLHRIRTTRKFERDGIKGFICANGRGYYLTFSIKEQIDYKERLIKRQLKEEEVIAAMGL